MRRREFLAASCASLASLGGAASVVHGQRIGSGISYPTRARGGSAGGAGAGGGSHQCPGLL